MVTLMFDNKFIKIGKDVIQFEINALKKLKYSIKKSFSSVVKKISSNKNGRLIISGVGKSGIIGKKWAGTFTSTGTPSFFLNASDASHGDMGMITSNDIVILISLSGDSEELKNIIRYCSRNKNICLIAVTSNKKSILYKSSDLKILIPSVKEAGPENIVPSSSTTLQIALGDALALSCMKLNNFDRVDFKRYHPSGALGTKLKTVSDLMIPKKNTPFVNENISLKNSIKIIKRAGFGVLIVRNKKSETVGILTDGDIKRNVHKFENMKDLKIKSIMKKKPISVDQDMLASQALFMMNSKKITSLCIHEKNRKNKTIGLLHVHNILKANIN